MRNRKYFRQLPEYDRPTERQALNSLTLAEIEDMALQILRKRALSRDAQRARRAGTPLTERS